MSKFNKMMLLTMVFSVFVLFNIQAQVDDTTDVDKPANTELGTPNTDMEFGAPQTQTQTDTTGKYAAHFTLAEDMTNSLGQTITLSEEQKIGVIKRIVEFQEEVADINIKMREEGQDADTQDNLDQELVSLVDDIEGMLDDSQRAEWIRVKNDWMTEVKTHIQSKRDTMQQERDIY